MKKTGKKVVVGLAVMSVFAATAVLCGDSCCKNEAKKMGLSDDATETTQTISVGTESETTTEATTETNYSDKIEVLKCFVDASAKDENGNPTPTLVCMGRIKKGVKIDTLFVNKGAEVPSASNHELALTMAPDQVEYFDPEDDSDMQEFGLWTVIAEPTFEKGEQTTVCVYATDENGEAIQSAPITHDVEVFE